MALAHDLAIINTFFTKPEEHLVTYKSGEACTQIDYILTDRKQLDMQRLQSHTRGTSYLTAQNTGGRVQNNKNLRSQEGENHKNTVA